MKKYRLLDLDVDTLGRGWVFRCKGNYPYEKIVDFLLRENRDSPSEFTLIVMSGFKAGCDLVHLPAEAGSLIRGLSKIGQIGFIQNVLWKKSKFFDW